MRLTPLMLATLLALAAGVSAQQFPTVNFQNGDPQQPQEWKVGFEPAAVVPDVRIRLNAPAGGWVGMVLDAYVTGETATAPSWLLQPTPGSQSLTSILSGVATINEPTYSQSVEAHAEAILHHVAYYANNPVQVPYNYVPILTGTNIVWNALTWDQNLPAASPPYQSSEYWQPLQSGAPYGAASDPTKFDVVGMFRAAVVARAIRHGVPLVEVDAFFSSEMYYQALTNAQTHQFKLTVQPVYFPGVVPGPTWTGPAPWGGHPMPAVVPTTMVAGPSGLLHVREPASGGSNLAATNITETLAPGQWIFFDHKLPNLVVKFKVTGGYQLVSATSAIQPGHPFGMKVLTPPDLVAGRVTAWPTWNPTNVFTLSQAP